MTLALRHVADDRRPGNRQPRGPAKRLRAQAENALVLLLGQPLPAA
jgi:hypothetical protein